MFVNCCIAGCPTVVTQEHVNCFFAFPKKETAQYKKWIDVCKDSKSNILQLKEPRICPIHFTFRVRMRLKILPTDIPSRYLTPEELKGLNKEVASINHLVAEWLDLTQRKTPQQVVRGKHLKAKAKEVANILRINSFDVELGWLCNFQIYLNKNGLKHWRKLPVDGGDKEKLAEKSATQDCDVVVLAEDEESSKQLDLDHSIKTYREALAQVKLLGEYVKRTKNNNAAELIAQVQEVLTKTLE